MTTPPLVDAYAHLTDAQLDDMEQQLLLTIAHLFGALRAGRRAQDAMRQHHLLNHDCQDFHV